MDWDTVCKSKKLGGLGIERLRDKGVSLMAKWVWRFGKDHSSLWKKVVCSKYGLKNDGLVWEGLELKSPSHFVKTINGLLRRDNDHTRLLKTTFKWWLGQVIRLGSGKI